MVLHVMYFTMHVLFCLQLMLQPPLALDMLSIVDQVVLNVGWLLMLVPLAQAIP